VYAAATITAPRLASGIYAVDVETGATTRLTDAPEGVDTEAEWSPNGERVLVRRRVCTQCDGPGSKIVLAAADGSGETALPGTEQFLFGGSSWSPDGARFVYGADKLYVSGADGRDVQAIVDLPGSGYEPVAWAGDEIVFLRTAALPTTMYAAQPDGNELELLHVGQGAVAPDGVTVAELGDEQLVITSPGREDVVIARDRLDELGVAGPGGEVLKWSPDSALVAIAIGEKSGSGVAVADLAGNVDLVIDEELDGVVRWSPDSEHLAYSAEGALWAVDAAGGEPVRLASVVSPPGFDWSPDGERLAYYDGTDVRAVSAQGGTSDVLFSAGLERYAANGLRWSLDGRRIAVTTGSDIAIGDVDTAQAMHVSADVVDIRGMEWTEDSSALAIGGYVIEAGLGRPGVYLVDAESGALSTLTYSAGRRHELLSRLADGRLVFASLFTL
jgi:Tol biopolymer transport system component